MVAVPAMDPSTAIAPAAPRSATDRRDGAPVVSKADQARRTRELIVRTGIACIARYGYAQTSMHLISKEAKISRGPLHYHFRDKNDLMGAIAAAIPGTVDDRTAARLAAAETVRDRLEAIIGIALEQHLGDHHVVALELLTASRRDEALAAAVLPHIAASERRVDRWWIEFARGLDWPDERLRAFRTVFVASLRGLSIDHNTAADPRQHQDALAMLREMLIAYAFGARDGHGTSQGVGPSRPRPRSA